MSSMGLITVMFDHVFDLFNLIMNHFDLFNLINQTKFGLFNMIRQVENTMLMEHASIFNLIMAKIFNLLMAMIFVEN